MQTKPFVTWGIGGGRAEKYLPIGYGLVYSDHWTNPGSMSHPLVCLKYQIPSKQTTSTKLCAGPGACGSSEQHHKASIVSQMRKSGPQELSDLPRSCSKIEAKLEGQRGLTTSPAWAPAGCPLEAMWLQEKEAVPAFKSSPGGNTEAGGDREPPSHLYTDGGSVEWFSNPGQPWEVLHTLS